MARLAVLALALPVALLAQEQEEPFRQTIVVTAERLDQPREEATAAVTVLTRADLERIPAATLGDVLRYVPGLQSISVLPGAPSMISSRGFFGAGEVDYMQLIIDGVPTGEIDSGLADWQSIPIESIDHIEILRGPGSSLFGDAAMGGVVQVFRRRANHLEIGAGSSSTHQMNGSYAADGIEADLHLRESDGFRDHGEFAEGTAGFRVERSKLNVTLDASRREREEPGPRDAAELASSRFGSNSFFRFDQESHNRARVAVQYQHAALRATLHGAVKEGEGVRTLLLAPGLADRAARTIDTERFGLEVRGDWSRRIGRVELQVAAGVEGMQDSLEVDYFEEEGGERGSLRASGEASRDRAALFLSSDLRLTPRLRLSSGLRWDRIGDQGATDDLRENAVSPRLGVNWQIPRSDAHVYLQFSRAFKAPTLEQRFDVRPLPDFQGGTFTISNPRLRSQYGRNLEVGFIRVAPSHQVEVVAYAMNVRDEIDFDLSTFRYGNIGRSRHRGVETAAEWRPGPFKSRLSYTWTSVRPAVGDDRDRQLKNIAEHLARAGATVEFARRATLDISLEHSAGRFLDDANLFPLPDATVIDLRARTVIGRATLSLDVRNLTGEDSTPLGFALTGFDGVPVPYYFPAEGRSFAFALRWSPSHLDGGEP